MKIRLIDREDSLDRVLTTAFRKEADYIKQRRIEAINRMGQRWLLAAKRGKVQA